MIQLAQLDRAFPRIGTAISGLFDRYRPLDHR